MFSYPFLLSSWLEIDVRFLFKNLLLLYILFYSKKTNKQILFHIDFLIKVLKFFIEVLQKLHRKFISIEKLLHLYE